MVIWVILHFLIEKACPFIDVCLMTVLFSKLYRYSMFFVFSTVNINLNTKVSKKCLTVKIVVQILMQIAHFFIFFEFAAIDRVERRAVDFIPFFQ